MSYAVGWVVLAALAIGGLLLETAHRAPTSSLLGWFSLWILGGGLAVTTLARALYLVLPDRQLPGAWAPVVGAALLVGALHPGSGLGLVVLAAVVTTAAVVQIVDAELPGWGPLGGWLWAGCPALLSLGPRSALGAAALLVALQGARSAHPLGLVVLVLAACADPVAGVGAACLALAVGRPKPWFGLPFAVALVSGWSQLGLGDPVAGPARLVLQQTLALGWPFGVAWMFVAAPRWQAVCIGVLVASVGFGADGSLLLVPVVLGSIEASIGVVGTRAARSLWLATVLVVAAVYTPRWLQTDRVTDNEVEEDE